MPETTIDLNYLADAPFGEQVLALRQLFGFTQRELGQVLGGISERTVSRWEQEATDSPHPQSKLAIDALRTMAEALGDLFEPEIIKVWVDKPNPALGGERPRDFAKKIGGIYRMSQLLGANGR